MNRFDLIMFDCDGVLIDSETLGSRALSEAMGTVGHDMSIPNVEATFSGVGEVETRALLNAKGLPADVIMKTAARKLSALFAQGVDPIEGIESVLENQHVKICVASNSSVSRLNDSFGRTPLAAFFGQHIYSANHVAVGKPAPDLAFHCLERMSTSAERAIFVDDNTHGVCCARDAGVLAIGFIGPSDHRPDHAETLRRAGADFVVHGAKELGVLLSELTTPAVNDHFAEKNLISHQPRTMP